MKKIFLVLSLFTANYIFAQIHKGTFLAGLGFNYSQDNTSTRLGPHSFNYQSYTAKNSNTSLRAGYFIANNIAVGINAAYSTSLYKQDDLQQFTRSTSVVSSLGLFTRLYKLSNNNKYGVFCHVESSYIIGQSSSTSANSNLQNTDSKGNITGFNIGVRPGFVYFITDKIGLEATFGNFGFLSQAQQNYEKGQKTNLSSTQNLNLNLGMNTLYLGFHFYLGGKK